MTVNKPYAQDYANQMQDLVNQITKLDMVVTTRLYTLSVSYPQAPICTMRNEGEEVVIKADSLIPATRGKSIIKDLPFDIRIEYIASIEAWLKELQPNNQTEIEFPKLCDVQVCNCDKRDMPVYEEEGKHWCPQCGLQVK
jgi:hypothetical protein